MLVHAAWTRYKEIGCRRKYKAIERKGRPNSLDIIIRGETFQHIVTTGKIEGKRGMKKKNRGGGVDRERGRGNTPVGLLVAA